MKTAAWPNVSSQTGNSLQLRPWKRSQSTITASDGTMGFCELSEQPKAYDVPVN